MEIPEPPSRPICSGCNEKLIWLYSARKSAWVSFVVLTEHRLQPHQCFIPARKRGLWSPDPAIIRRTARGRALADATLAGRPNPFTEETDR